MANRDFSAVLSTINQIPETRAVRQQVLHAIVSAVAANNMGVLELYFTEDVELRIHGFAPIDGFWRGRADVIAAATRNFQKFAQQQTQVETMVDEGDNVVWLVVESGCLNETGERYEVRGVMWFTFAGTQIRRVEEFLHATSPT